MLVRFTSRVNLQDVSRLTERCESLGVQYKYIQELGSGYLVIESADRSKLEELYHQFRHMEFVEAVILSREKDDPLSRLEPVKIKCGNRWIGAGSRPVVIAGSPYLESQKQAVSLASDLATMGVNIYKAGPYRASGTLAPKSLYQRTAAIISDVTHRSGIPSTGMVEALGPKVALEMLQACALHVPGHFLFETNLRAQLAKMTTPILLERHPHASTELWLEAAGSIVDGGNTNVALVETGVWAGDRRQIDLVELSALAAKSPLPLLVYPSKAARTGEEVRRIARAALAAGAAGVMIDVHPNPVEGLLTDGFCLSLAQFEEVLQTLKPLMV